MQMRLDIATGQALLYVVVLATLILALVDNTCESTEITDKNVKVPIARKYLTEVCEAVLFTRVVAETSKLTGDC